MSIHNVTSRVGSTEIKIETGKIARLADGSVTVQSGETIVVVTAVSATQTREGQDWFPLSVEYKEKAAAVGLFPGGYFKREGRPSEKEILTCRMTDRPLRPLFPKGYLYDTQIVAILLSADGENDADILSMNGASAALCVSDIPFAGPIGAVRVGRVNGEFIANPTHTERADSDLDLVYVGSKTEVIMIEGSAIEMPEEDFIKALHFAQGHAATLIEAQEELARLAGKPKREVPLMEVDPQVLDIATEVAADKIEGAIYNKSKVERNKAVAALREEVVTAVRERFPEAPTAAIDEAFDSLKKKAFRKSIFEKGVRSDGRKPKELRPLSAEVGILPRSHGSALFARGETMALAAATLAPADEAQRFDAYTGGVDTKSFILHYNFPPFSVGETGRMGGFNRREIGHGALAERSVEPLVPPQEKWPYAIRVSSEIMESNGSTSMATVCAASLSLMDAGVPMERPVAGISVGLAAEKDADGTITRYETLLDILGSEDFFGDMDFKLCGTELGVTGYQLDLKLPGIPLAILEEAISLAKEGRGQVLEAMHNALPEPRKELSKYAPRIDSLKIDPDRIGDLIGPGGKVIRGIQAETGTEISVDEDGTVHIYAIKPEGLERAMQLVKRQTANIEVGEVYSGRIVSTTNFGAFMEVIPGKDGMIHISELADYRVQSVEDIVKSGDHVEAKCIGVDEKGRVKMSIRALIKDKPKQASADTADDVEDVEI